MGLTKSPREFLVFIALLLFLSLSAAAAQVSIEPSSRTSSTGDRLGINVDVGGVSNLYGFQFDLEYDSSVLRFVEIDQGPFLRHYGDYDTFCVSPDTRAAGLMKEYACSIKQAGAEGVSGAGTLGQVVFEAIGNGVSPVSLKNVKLSDPDAHEIPATSEHGQVRVGGQSGTIVIVSDASVKVGDAFTINVDVEEVSHLFGFQFDLRYDASILEFSSVEEGPFLNEGGSVATFCVDSEVSPGLVNNVACVVQEPGSDGASGGGTIAKFTFRAKKEGTTSLTLSNVLLSDPSSNPISSGTKAGTVTVGGGTVKGTRVVVSEESAAVGETVEVKVNIQEVVDLYGYQLDISYDSSILQLEKVRDGSMLGADIYCAPVKTDEGSIKNIACVRKGDVKGASGTGTLTSLTFKVKSSGTAYVNLNLVKLINSELQYMPAPSQNGKVVVGGTTTGTLVRVSKGRTELWGNADITVSINDVTDLYGYQFDIRYDPSIVEFVSVSKGNFLGDPYCVEPEISSGLIKNIACTKKGKTGGESGSGQLQRLTFRAIGRGTTEIVIENLLLSSSDSQSIQTGSENGKITVGECDHPADANRDGKVSIGELREFVVKWLEGKVSDEELETAVRFWYGESC